MKAGEKIGELGKSGGPWGEWNSAHLHIERCNGTLKLSGKTISAPGTYTSEGPISASDLPDLNVKRVEISPSGQNNWQHSITIESGQSFKYDIETDVENKGEGDTEDEIEVEYYLSRDKNFDKDDDVRLGKDTIDELDSGEDEEEHLTGIQAPTTPGTYYIFVYIDYDKDEEHNSNNYSSETDSEEYAVLNVVTANHKPTGYLDSADCTHIRGWARDPDTSQSIEVHFYRDGQAGSGIFMGKIVADKYRVDLPFSDKNHGFDISTPSTLKDGNLHTVYVYAIDSSGGTNSLLGHSGVLCVSEAAYGKPVYRFWNDQIDNHFYTISESEKDKLIDQGEYKYEGIAFYAFDGREADTSPVFRFWSSKLGDHLFTASTSERDKLLNNPDWAYENVAFYVYSFKEVDTKAVYRLRNKVLQDHFYTASISERDKLLQSADWVDEGTAWYIPTEDMSPPTSKFSMTPTAGIGSVKVTFTNNSTGSINSYKWTFGDGSTSTQKNPSHTYNSPGIYDVKLEVSGPRSWTSQTTKEKAVTVYSQASCAFSATPNTGAAPLSVLFSDQSTGDIDKWEWTFGDGNTGDTQSPIHKYQQPGKYTVTLKVGGNGGTDTETKSDFIFVTTSCPNCDGANPTIDNITLYDGSECECTASESVTIGPNVILKKGSKLTVNSKKINVKAKVNAEEGAILELKSE